MAEISVTAKKKGRWLTFEWSGATESDTFEEIYIGHNVADILVEAEGTFGGATVTFDGWVVTEAASFDIVDPGGIEVSLTADGSSPVRDAFPFLRPAHTGGTSENIDIRIYMKVV